MTDTDTTNARIDLDWALIGKKAHEYGVRFQTNTRLMKFVQEVNVITAEDVVREGFPSMSPSQFTKMLVRKDPSETNNRIEFRYLDEPEHGEVR
jgi:hypothetical protein